MTPEEDQQPVLRLTPGWRRGLAVGAIGLAGLHVFVPTLAIDAILLGLLGFAGFVTFFDIQSVELGGITAARRLESAQKALDAAPRPAPALLPPAPEPGASAALPQGAPKPPTPIAPDLPLEPLERFTWALEQIRIELTILAGNYGRLPERTSHTIHHVGSLLKLLAPTNAYTGTRTAAQWSVLPMVLTW